MKMRIGHRIFDITNKDIVVSTKNLCYVATQTYFNNWCNVKPTMSKTQFKKLLKENVLQLFCTKNISKTKTANSVICLTTISALKT